MNNKKSEKLKGRCARKLVVLGSLAVGAVHVAWGRGSSWPFTSRVELSQKVVGSNDFPDATACYVVAAGAFVTAAVFSKKNPGAGNVFFRRLVVLAVGARSIAGGKKATEVLRLPQPGQAFLDADKKFYRPLTAIFAIAAATLAKRAR